MPRSSLRSHHTAARSSMRSLAAAALALMVSATGASQAISAEADGATEAPPGYTWYEFSAGDSAYLRPNGWFIKTEVKGDTATLAISKENIEVRGSFDTGLTVNVVRKIKAKTGVKPSEYSVAYLGKLMESKKDVLTRFSTPPQSGFSGLGARYRDSEPPPATIVHTYLLADDEADVLRIIIFEAPEKDWDAAWVHGEKMLNGKAWRVEP